MTRDTVTSLAGQWQFLMNGPQPGTTQEPLPALAFTDTIELPGTTETRRKGPEQPSAGAGQFTRRYHYDAPAWYQRTFTLPADWSGKQVTLFLERTKYTQVWLDGQPVGECPIICSPHEYALGQLTPGEHSLTIMVDNTRRPVPGEMHQMSDNTQGNWNGILGRIELRATALVWLDDVQVYPGSVPQNIEVSLRIGNATGRKGTGGVILRAGLQSVVTCAHWTETGGEAIVDLDFEPAVQLWDEFNPHLFRLTVELSSDSGKDVRELTLGLRSFTTKGTQFAINGRTTFLRGRHDACVFPLTGHPPMEIEGWLQYFRICQQYGLNHVRFHSWCPPEAAFAAADLMGFYLQPELPFWGNFTEDVKMALKPEGERIMRHFGNHPSFVMFTLGNEHWTGPEVMASLVAELRELDPRHVYSQGSNALMGDPQFRKGDDYLVSARVKSAPDSPARNIRGSHCDMDDPNGHVQAGPPGTMANYSAAIEGVPAPIISHEIGQWSVSPDFREIARYTGVMRAGNFEHFRDRLRASGLLDQSDQFVQASGKLAALCYREEIEAALRTGGFGGFQLLDLQDFPGQGTALVGILNSFMESKGLIAPEEWRQFCSPIVLLARFERYTWTTAQSLQASIEVAHYGPADLPQAVISWQLSHDSGSLIATGTLPATDIAQGGLRTIGQLQVALSNIPTPSRLTLTLTLQGTSLSTSYPLWIYPPAAPLPVPPGVKLARDWNDNTEQALARGETVLLVLDERWPRAHTVGGGFTTEFWCWPMFHNRPGTMGLLCDPSHTALKQFPTDSHSNWQWFHLARHSQPLILDEILPPDYHPIVQVIDNMERVHHLGMVFELRVGPGKLLLCATDLLAMDEHPEARQLCASLLAYASSSAFQPTHSATPAQLRELLLATLPLTGATASASTFDPDWRKQIPQRAIDGNDYTIWLAADATTPQWLQVTFPQPVSFSGIEILWPGREPAYRYTVECSSDGTTWRPYSDQSNHAFSTPRHRLLTSGTDVLTLRITITALPGNSRAGVAEIRFLRS